MNSFEEVWKHVLKNIEKKISAVSYSTWIKPIKPMKLENNEAFIYAQSNFQKGIIIEKFKSIITESFCEVMGFDITVNILSEEDVPPKKIDLLQEKDAAEIPIPKVEEKEQTGKLNEDLTFDNFVVGNENKFAHAAALAVANNPAGAYNPFFIWGKSGLGKTHLLSAIANEIKKNNPSAIIMLVKGEDFTYELIQAIKNGEQTKFRQKYRYVDVFLVDDVQFIGGKVSTELEFFHTFETLYEAKKQIIVTSDRPPKDMATLEDRLKTRFEAGLIADIQPPEYETRVAIIKNKAEQLHLKLSDDVIDFIATKLKNNVREIEGAVKKIEASQNLYFGEMPNLAMVKEIIQSVIKENINDAITIKNIVEQVSKYCNIPENDILGKKRDAKIMDARQIAMYLSRELIGLSLQQIGEEFGGKNHSTVLHSINKIEEKLEINPKFAQEIQEMTENIKKSF